MAAIIAFMPLIVRSGDVLLVQPLVPMEGEVARFFAELGHAYDPSPNAFAARTGLDPERIVLESIGRKHPLKRSLAELTKYTFPIRSIRRLEAGPRFPSLTLVVKGPGSFDETYDLTPALPTLVVGVTPPEVLAWSRAVDALFTAAADRRWPGVREPGWADRPAAEWEKVDGFPEQAPTGGYRGSARSSSTFLAERDAGGPWERLARALLPGGRRSPTRVALTREGIYARFSGDQVWRLPRGLPAGRDGDRWVFGRFAGFLLPQRPDCPVEAVLCGER